MGFYLIIKFYNIYLKEYNLKKAMAYISVPAIIVPLMIIVVKVYQLYNKSKYSHLDMSYATSILQELTTFVIVYGLISIFYISILIYRGIKRIRMNKNSLKEK